jgi:hypothetical protein
LTPGTVIGRRISGQGRACPGDRLLHRRDLGVEERDLGHPGVDRLALLEAALQARLDLVLGKRAGMR